jgi:hypothetical protein
MMIAVNIDDAATGEALVSQVAEQFKLHRTLAPPNTSMMLVTLVGDLTADRFADLKTLPGRGRPQAVGWGFGKVFS